MRHQTLSSTLMLTLLAPLIAGCSGASDLLSKDAEWFSKPSRVFIKSISIESPPLTPDKPVQPEDLVSANGACPGMAPADASTAPASTGGTVALGHTECDVVRGIGAPDNVSLSNNERGDRVAVITWQRGSRAGIYTFTSGRLSSIEGASAPEPSPKTVKPKSKPKKKPAAT